MRKINEFREVSPGVQIHVKEWILEGTMEKIFYVLGVIWFVIIVVSFIIGFIGGMSGTA